MKTQKMILVEILMVFTLFVAKTFTQSVFDSDDWGSLIFNKNEAAPRSEFEQSFLKALKTMNQDFQTIISQQTFETGKLFKKTYRKATITFPDAIAVGYSTDSVFGLMDDPFHVLTVFYYASQSEGNSRQLFLNLKEKLRKIQKEQTGANWQITEETESKLILQIKPDTTPKIEAEYSQFDGNFVKLTFMTK